MGFRPAILGARVVRLVRRAEAWIAASLLFGCGVVSCLAWQRGLYANATVAALLALWVAATKNRVGLASDSVPALVASPPLARHEADLRQLRATLDQVPTPLLSQAPDGSLRALNRAARILFHADDLIPEPPDALRDAIGAAALGQPALVALAQAGGRSTAVSVATSFGPDGARLLAVLTDVQAEIQAAEAAALRDLLSVLAHEIMNALTPVTSLAETAHAMLVEGGAEAPGQAREALEIILRRAQGLDRFVQGYRQLARVPEPLLRPTPASQVLQEAAALFRARWSRHGVALVVGAPSPEVIAPMDAALIGQALLNLLTNAGEAALAHGGQPCVWLEARAEGGGLAFHVADNGAGVDPSRAALIFQPFHTDKAGGSGIGLTIARQIAQAHGGTLVLGERETGALFVLHV
jgi:signal transduction histidine kinase